MSTGGAAMNAMMKTDVAVRSVGIISTPNHPMYRRFSVEVMYEQKRLHRVAFFISVKIYVNI
jgi:hypothetical protein